MFYSSCAREERFIFAFTQLGLDIPHDNRILGKALFCFTDGKAYPAPLNHVRTATEKWLQNIPPSSFISLLTTDPFGRPSGTVINDGIFPDMSVRPFPFSKLSIIGENVMPAEWIINHYPSLVFLVLQLA